MGSKKVNIIISIVAAVVLWIYVVGEMDPRVTKTYHDITIRYTNEQALENYGLDVENYGTETVSVTLTGNRSAINKVKKSDIAVVVDLSDAKLGTNKLTIHVTPPQNTEVSRQSLSNANVEVGNFITESKPIRISYLGDYGEKEPTTLSLSQENVNVSGAEGAVDKVSFVRGEIEKNDVGTKKKSVRTSLTAVDKDGNAVKNVRLSSTTVNVTSILYSTKSVKLNVEVKNQDAGDLERTFDLPETIKVKGSAKALKKLKEITAEPIDLSSVTKDQTVEIKPILPDGIELANGYSKLLSMKVKVSSTEQKKVLSLDEDAVQIENAGDGIQYTVQSGTLKVTVTGTKKQLSEIEENDVHLSASIKDLAEGSHSIPIDVTCDKECQAVTVDPSSITVTVRNKSEGN